MTVYFGKFTVKPFWISSTWNHMHYNFLFLSTLLTSKILHSLSQSICIQIKQHKIITLQNNKHKHEKENQYGIIGKTKIKVSSPALTLSDLQYSCIWNHVLSKHVLHLMWYELLEGSTARRFPVRVPYSVSSLTCIPYSNRVRAKSCLHSAHLP